MQVLRSCTFFTFPAPALKEEKSRSRSWSWSRTIKTAPAPHQKTPDPATLKNELDLPYLTIIIHTKLSSLYDNYARVRKSR